MGTLVGTLVGALVGVFVGPLVGPLMDPLVGLSFAVRVLCASLKRRTSNQERMNDHISDVHTEFSGLTLALGLGGVPRPPLPKNLSSVPLCARHNLFGNALILLLSLLGAHPLAEQSNRPKTSAANL